MRAREFLKEDEIGMTVPQLKKEIVGQVRSVNDFGILDRIYQVLSQKGNRAKIENAFMKNTKEANVGINPDQIIDDMINAINNIAGTTKEKLDFVEALEKGKAVDTKALLSRTATFSDIFSSPLAQKFFESISNYGRGSGMKGPGEFALAIMSPKISLAAKGDLKIGNKLVEVKAAIGAGGKGGRLGETGIASRDQIVDAIRKVAKKYKLDPTAAAELQTMTSKKSMGLAVAVRQLHSIYGGKAAPISATVKAVVEMTFGAAAGTAVGRAAGKDASGLMAEQEYMKHNFDWYKKKGGFQEVLAIWFSGKKTFAFATGAELLQLRASGVFGAPSVSFIPSKANEFFTQINFTKTQR